MPFREIGAGTVKEYVGICIMPISQIGLKRGTGMKKRGTGMKIKLFPASLFSPLVGGSLLTLSGLSPSAVAHWANFVVGTVADTSVAFLFSLPLA